jgi:hypothetical protein
MCRLVVFPSFVMDSSSTFRATASLEMWHDAQVGCQRRSVSQNTGKTVGGIYSSIQYIYIHMMNHDEYWGVYTYYRGVYRGVFIIIIICIYMQYIHIIWWILMNHDYRWHLQKFKEPLEESTARNISKILMVHGIVVDSCGSLWICIARLMEQQ